MNIDQFKKKASFDAYLKKKLRKPSFKRAYEVYMLQVREGERITKLREKEKITQKELARRTKIRQPNISRIERGEVSPSLEILHRIYAGLGRRMSISYKK